MADNTSAIPPVPSKSDLTESVKDSKKLSVTWIRWFTQLRDKINVINASIVNLAGFSGTGFLSSDGAGTFTGRTITGDAGEISVVEGDGISGDPAIGLVASGVTPGNYGDSTHYAVFTVDAFGRLTFANQLAGGGGGGSPLTTKGDIFGFSTADARIPVGADGTVLTADSTAALGVSYQTPGGGPSYVATVLADTPIGFWELADTSGTTAVDSSGHGLNGTYSGGFTLLGSNVTRNLPGGVLLNGSNACITIPPNALLNVGTTWTVEAWAFLSTSTGPTCFIVEKFNANAVSFALGVTPDASGGTYISGGYFATSWQVAKGPTIAPQGELLYYALTYNAGVISLYMQGMLIQSITTATLHVASNDGIFLGVNNGGVSGFMSGILSCCALYGTTLSAARIKAHYLAGR